VTIQIPVLVFGGLVALSVLALILGVLLALTWLAGNRREDALIDRHAVERDRWLRERHEMWRSFDELSRVLSEIQGAINVRRATGGRRKDAAGGGGA
jgi:hypothetical protein